MRHTANRGQLLSVSSRCSLFIIAASSITCPASAQCFATDPVASFGGDNQASARAGEAVAIHGDTIVVGAPGYDNGQGAAFVYIRSGNNWVFQQKLVASDRAASDRFGNAVAINGDTILIGADGDDNSVATDAGAAYIFNRSSGAWSQATKFTASDGAVNDNFGWAVAFATLPNRLVALIGSPRDQSVHTFSLNTLVIGAAWSSGGKFTPSDAPANFFGHSLSASGSTVAVGAIAGRCYVFTGSTIGGWTQQQRIDSPAGASPGFGISVGLNGNNLIVSDAGANTPLADVAGAAHIYVRSSGVWSYQQRLYAADGHMGADFSSSVAIAGDRALVGSHYENTFGSESGAAFIFTRNGEVWSQRQKFYGLFQAGERFGGSTAIQGNTTVVGAIRYNAGTQLHAGRAYVHEFIQLDISSQPSSITTCLTGPATFTAGITEFATTSSLQWQYKPGNAALYTSLVDGPNMEGATFLLNALGANQPILTVDRGSLGWNVPGPLNFRLIASSPDCPVSPSSAIVTLTICKADFNCTGDITVQDLFDFLAAYFGGEIAADINNSGALSVQDIFDFLVGWFEGCSS